jgi:hypothetical protein
VFLELFGAAEVLSNLSPDQRFRAFVFLIYAFNPNLVEVFPYCLRYNREENGQTFKRKHEVVEGILVLFVRLGVVLLLVFVDCNLHKLDCTLVANIVSSARGAGGTVI